VAETHRSAWRAPGDIAGAHVSEKVTPTSTGLVWRVWRPAEQLHPV